jgi:hypothetical protein
MSLLLSIFLFNPQNITLFRFWKLGSLSVQNLFSSPPFRHTLSLFSL